MADGSQPLTDAHKRALELLDKLWNDGEIGATLRKKAKEQFGNAITIPDDTIDPIVAPLRKEVETLRKQISDDAEKLSKERKDGEDKSARANLEKGLNDARNNYHLTDEGFDKMVERMKTTGNYSDPDAAAAWVASKSPPPAPPGPTWAPQQLKMPGTPEGDDLKLLHSDPSAYTDKVLGEFLKDPQGFTDETFGRAA